MNADGAAALNDDDLVTPSAMPAHMQISLDLGFVPALAGVSATLLLIPLQAVLVRPVAGIRR